MKKINITVALALGLVIPFAAIAATSDDEVTIRMIQMHEKSSASVMSRVELTDIASDKVTEEAIEHKAGGEDVAEMDWDRINDLEQVQNQDRNREEVDLIQDQVRDNERDIQRGQGTGAGSK